MYIYIYSPYYMRKGNEEEFNLFQKNNSRDSSVGVATGYGLDGLRPIHDGRKRFFSLPQRLDQLWGPHSLLSNGYGGSLPLGKAA
jgi:hypothetical protein